MYKQTEKNNRLGYEKFQEKKIRAESKSLTQKRKRPIAKKYF